jgi:quinoprotein glucose dehydrogenase
VPITSFGAQGASIFTDGLGRPVDRRWYTVTSPPLVIGDLVIVGSSIEARPLRPDMPPGHVRAFDVRTGAQRWIFHSVPQSTQVRYRTWEGESWRTVGGRERVDDHERRRGARLRLSALQPAANDYYGGERHGDNLFADSLVCLEAATGRRVWHFQLVRHGLWDYDIPAAPNLVDITIGAPRACRRAGDQAGIRLRVRSRDGPPLWPIEDRPVPPSTVPGEKTPAAAVPHAPAPFERQNAGPADVIDFTPELRERRWRFSRATITARSSRPPASAAVVLFRRRRRRGLGRRRVRSRHGPSLRAVDHRAQRRDLEPSAAGVLKDRYVGRLQGLQGHMACRCSSRRSGA